MERAPESGVKRTQPDTQATFMDRAQRRGRGVNTSRDWVGTAQTTVSVGRLGVEGTKEDMGAGACTLGQCNYVDHNDSKNRNR